MDVIEDLLTRGVANIIPRKTDLVEVLKSGRKLNVYLGIDPTSTHIHLGNAVPLRKLQIFADLGHHVTFLIGDFTTLIGDTSDKDSERPVLTSEQIETNFQTYKQQASKLVDFSKITVRHNSEWLSKLGYAEIIKIADIIIDVFAAESVLLRAADAGDALHQAAAQVFVTDAAGRVEIGARTALAAMSDGDTLRTLLAALRRVMKITPVNTVRLRREVAERVLAGKRYPL